MILLQKDEPPFDISGGWVVYGSRQMKQKAGPSEDLTRIGGTFFLH